MNIQIESSVINEALRVIARLATPSNGSVILASDGHKLFMHSSSDLARCSINLPCEISGKATIAVELDALRDAIRNRKELSIKYEKMMLKITAGNYRAELATTDAVEFENNDVEELGKPIMFTGEQAVEIQAAVTRVSLRPTAILNSYMPCGLKITDKGAFIVCYDHQHMAFLHSKTITGDMNITLPVDTLLTVLDTFKTAKFKLQIGKSQLHIKNAICSIALSLPQVDDSAVSIDDVIGKAKEANKVKGSVLTVTTLELSDFLDNARAVLTKERGEMSVVAEEGKLRLAVTTNNGSTKANLKCKVDEPISFKIDIEYLEEALSKIKAESVSIKVVSQAFAVFSSEGTTVIVALNQD